MGREREREKDGRIWRAPQVWHCINSFSDSLFLTPFPLIVVVCFSRIAEIQKLCNANDDELDNDSALLHFKVRLD